MLMKSVWLAGLSVCLFLGVAAPVSAQSVKASVDRNPVMADETVQLIVETEDLSSSDAPDWQMLEENFELLGTTQSHQTSIVNMRTTKQTKWIATLAPKQAGTLIIPALTVGGHHTPPIRLTVTEPNHDGRSTDGREIFLEADVDTRVPLLHGQVLLTVRLISGISVQEGRLDEPDIEWGMMERVGKDVSFTTTRNGRQYQVTERRYVITPQKPGTQAIPPVQFSGKVPDEHRSGTLFDELFGNRRGLSHNPFHTSRTIHRRSPEIRLTVQNLPPDLKGRDWLPAQALSLAETWSADTDTLRMGDSLTRTVVIRAKGQRGEQLPELEVPDQANVKIYPDKAKTQTDFDGSWVVGSREEQHVLVPTQAGTVTLPAIHLPWWNVETSRWEEAGLPARTLTVLDSLQADLSDQGFASVDVPSGPRAGSAQHLTPSSTPAMIFPDEGQEAVIWRWIAGGALVMWLGTLTAWWQDRQRRKPSGRATSGDMAGKADSERKALQRVKSACLEQSAENTRTTLLQWASIKQGGRPCRSLGMVARILEQSVADPGEISAAIWHLDRRLYTGTKQPQDWDGRRFWEIIQPAMTAGSVKAPKPGAALPPLYLHGGVGEPS